MVLDAHQHLHRPFSSRNPPTDGSASAPLRLDAVADSTRVGIALRSWPSRPYTVLAPKTTIGVFKKIFKSSHRLQCSTYQTSKPTRSSHVLVAAPLICCHPLMPGFMFKRLRSSAVQAWACSGTSGRGPIKLI